jgi:hypothetical protein
MLKNDFIITKELEKTLKQLMENGILDIQEDL